jgi:hypothetical protein
VSQIAARAVWLRLHDGQPGRGVIGGRDRQRRDFHPVLDLCCPVRLLTLSGGVEGWFREPASLLLDSGQLRQQTAGGGPVARVLGQASRDQPAQFGRQGVETSRAVDQPVGQRGGRPGAEGPLTRGREGQHGSQAEDVTRRHDETAKGVLGGHEPG